MSASARPMIQGLVNGGQARAVVGARVYVLEADQGSSARRATSLLTSATGTPADEIGHYALSDQDGGFSIAGAYRCHAGHPVYLFARGGNSGGDGLNAAIGLMAWLGPCPESGNFDEAQPFITLNEVTTVAAAYAMEGLIADPTHLAARPEVAPGRVPGQSMNLVAIATGFTRDSLPQSVDGVPARTKIHTLANILAACVNSESARSMGCTTLFSNARSGGDRGRVPEDTASAALNIVRHPQANIPVLFALQPKLLRPFTPALETVPSDFTIPSHRGHEKSIVAELALSR